MFLKRSVLLSLLFLPAAITNAQKLKKSEQQIVTNLKTYIGYLADDKLEGRRTGTAGEKSAATYVARHFEAAGLVPKGDNGSYIQAFTIDEGRIILPQTDMSINEKKMDTAAWFPLTFSADGSFSGMVAPAIHESHAPWFYDIKDILSDNAGNPHFDLGEALRKQVEQMKSKGATSVLFFTSGSSDPELGFNGKSKEDRLSIPVIYLKKVISAEILKHKDDFLNIAGTVKTGEKTRVGHNVAGFINNGAANTIVIGAHLDHLGYGEDHNSLWAGKPEIHNGADDNASGTALVIEMAKLLKTSKYKNNNYLLVCFSGEELGLFGSKYFADHLPVPLSTVNFMINCDMVGRLNPDTKTITIGGYGTSPYWSHLPAKTKTIDVKFDSSGIGPSDHTSFYLKNIPVLFFFTGTHPDYHKPSDDADKINYTGELYVIQYIMDVIKGVNKAGKLQFLKTREPDMGNSPRFTVTLGIMPDYTYNGQGLRVDGVISGKVADKAGMKAGDVITRIGDYNIHDINDYMKALSHFKKGDKTTVTYNEGTESKTKSIEF